MLPSVTAHLGSDHWALLLGGTRVSVSVSLRLGCWTAPHPVLCLPPPRQQRPDRMHRHHQGRRHGPAVPGRGYLPDELGGARRVQAWLGRGQVRGSPAGTTAKHSRSSSRLAVRHTKISIQFPYSYVFLLFIWLQLISNDLRTT